MVFKHAGLSLLQLLMTRIYVTGTYVRTSIHTQVFGNVSTAYYIICNAWLICITQFRQIFGGSAAANYTPINVVLVQYALISMYVEAKIANKWITNVPFAVKFMKVTKTSELNVVIWTQWFISLEIPVLVQSQKSNNIALGWYLDRRLFQVLSEYSW